MPIFVSAGVVRLPPLKVPPRYTLDALSTARALTLTPAPLLPPTLLTHVVVPLASNFSAKPSTKPIFVSAGVVKFPVLKDPPR